MTIDPLQTQHAQLEKVQQGPTSMNGTEHTEKTKAAD